MKLQIKTKFYTKAVIQLHELSEVPYIDRIPTLLLLHKLRNQDEWVDWGGRILGSDNIDWFAYNIGYNQCMYFHEKEC